MSHTYTSGHFRVGSHHLSRELARSGDDVAHVSTSVSRVQQVMGRVSAEQLDALKQSGVRHRDGVVDVIPRVLLPLRVLPQIGWRSIVTSLGWEMADVTYVDEPMMWSSSLRKVSKRLVYRPTDLYLDGVKARRQRAILSSVDGVAATSHTVLASLGRLKVPHTVIENGVEYTRFANERGVREQRAVYVGALDARFDWAAVGLLGAAFPDWAFDIYGPGTPPSGLPTNVLVRGPVSYDALPRLLSTGRIGLLPMSVNPLNEGRSPMKLYEYLSAGLAVVSRKTPQISEDSNLGIFTYGTNDEMIAAFRSAEEVTRKAGEARGRQLAAQEDWSIKARQLSAFTLSI